jgi:hypothetical protein
MDEDVGISIIAPIERKVAVKLIRITIELDHYLS